MVNGNGKNVASFLRHTVSDKGDPARGIDGMPPNLGRDLLPHVITFQGVLSSIARVYRPSDEALKYSRENARYMLNDPIIRECLDQRMRSTALLNWHIEPDDAKDARQVELCDHIKAIIEHIPRFMQYRENLLRAVWFGRYAVSQWWQNKYIRGKMRMCVGGWRPVHGDKLVFRYDDGDGQYDPDQIGIRVGPHYLAGQRIGENIIEQIEPTDWGLGYFLRPWQRDLLAVHRHMIEDGEFDEPQNAGRIHGVGIRSVIYWAWVMKQEALAWMMEFLEKSAFGIELWYYPMGNVEAREKMRAAATERIGDGRNVVLVPVPPGEGNEPYGVNRVDPGMAGVESLKEVITNYFGHQIKRYILGQTLTSEAENTGLGSNLAAIHLDTYMSIVQYDATNLEETLTTDLVEPIKRLNKEFAWAADIPIRFRIDTQAADVGEKLDAMEKAWNMGMDIPAKDLGDMLGIRQPDKDEKILSKTAMMQQEQQAQAAAMGGDPQADGNGEPPKQMRLWPSAGETTDDVERVYRRLRGIQENERDAAKIARKLGVEGPEHSDRTRLEYSREEAIEQIKLRTAG